MTHRTGTMDFAAPAVLDFNNPNRIYLSPDDDGGTPTPKNEPQPSIDYSALAKEIAGALKEPFSVLTQKIDTLGSGKMEDFNRVVEQRQQAKANAQAAADRIVELEAALAAAQGETAQVETKLQRKQSFTDALKAAGVTKPGPVAKLLDIDDDAIAALINEDGKLDVSPIIEQIRTDYPEFIKVDETPEPENTSTKRKVQTPPKVDTSTKTVDAKSAAYRDEVSQAAVDKILKG